MKNNIKKSAVQAIIGFMVSTIGYVSTLNILDRITNPGIYAIVYFSLTGIFIGSLCLVAYSAVNKLDSLKGWF